MTPVAWDRRNKHSPAEHGRDTVSDARTGGKGQVIPVVGCLAQRRPLHQSPTALVTLSVFV